MKKLFLTFSFMFVLTLACHSQIVINEIMYNVPGMGEDEEFIELYNPGSSTVMLNGYLLRDFQDTFNFGSNDSIVANGYFLLARDTAIFSSSYGMMADVEYNLQLSNSGELLVLEDNGTPVDSVNYFPNSNNASWPSLNGQSIQLCDHTTDNNNGANWGTSFDSAGVNNQSTSNVIYATPGAMNNCFVPTYPLYPISLLRMNDANGVPDSLNVFCEIRGIAYCANNRASQSGYDFPFSNSDNQGGIRLFSFSDVSGYSFTAGDSLHIWGSVSQYNGLTQFTPDSIVVIAQGNPAPAPRIVTTLDESTENQFVQFDSMHVVASTWTTGAGFGFTAEITNGSPDTFEVRIDSDIDLFNQPAPQGTFSIAGWGGQYDFSSPYDAFYQLTPCSTANLTDVARVENNSDAVNVYPNPARSILNVDSDLNIESIQIHNTLGQLVYNQMNINTNNTQVNTNNLENGVYIISIQTANRIMTQQFQVVK